VEEPLFAWLPTGKREGALCAAAARYGLVKTCDGGHLGGVTARRRAIRHAAGLENRLRRGGAT